MSVLTTMDHVRNLMEKHQIRYWKLKDSDGRSIIAEQKDSEVEPAQALELLELTMEEIEGKYVLLELRERSSKERGQGGDLKSGIFDLRVRVPNSPMQGIGNVNAQMSMYGNPLVQQLNDRINAMEKANLEQKHNFEMAEMRRQIDELKGGNPLMDQVIQGLANHFVPQVGSNQQAAPEPAHPVRSLAGHDQPKPSALQSALKRLAKVDDKLVQTLEALATFAEKNPEQYHGYVQMLKAQQ